MGNRVAEIFYPAYIKACDLVETPNTNWISRFSVSRGAVFRLFLFLSFALSSSSLSSTSVVKQEKFGQVLRPSIAIIVDDLGDTLEAGKAVVDLPYPITYSFLPHTPHAYPLAQRASSQGKEIMLHQPMQPIGHASMGPGGLYMGMSEQDFKETIYSNFGSLPTFAGVNNHMGSMLTRYNEPMTWLMEAMTRQGDLYFVDSYTTLSSVAHETARSSRLSSITRDVFLDHDKNFSDMEFHFQRLIKIAQRTGSALAIIHPHPQSIAFLKNRLSDLAEQGVSLVPVSQLITIRERRNSVWQASSSPLLKVAKN